MPNNTPSSLDLYAKVEDMIGVKDVADDLYAHYLLSLNTLEFSSLLDVGCGSGDFIRKISSAFPDAVMSGIDLSPVMVERAREQGVDARVIDLCDMDGRYDVITAVFDMLNYLDRESLERFAGCLRDRLSDGGYLLCDINTEYGFADIAVGSFITEDEDRFLTIDSDYEDGVYSSDFTLFERDKELWRKSSETIRQYYYSPQELADILQMELVSDEPVSLYGDGVDKRFLVLKNGQ